MAQVVSDGVQIRYDDIGQGEPALLLMTGWCANRTVFQNMAIGLGAHRRVLALGWRGHGELGAPKGDFGESGLVDDALAVIQASAARQVVPVALAQASWVAVELRRRLGERIPKLVLLDCLILEAPPPSDAALDGMQAQDCWKRTVNCIFDVWHSGVNNPALTQFVRREMGAVGYDMWARAGRPLRELARLRPPVPVLCLYAQPGDKEVLAGQQAFAAANPWFHLGNIAARGHSPRGDVPDQIESAIEQFVSQGGHQVRSGDECLRSAAVDRLERPSNGGLVYRRPDNVRGKERQDVIRQSAA